MAQTSKTKTQTKSKTDQTASKNAGSTGKKSPQAKAGTKSTPDKTGTKTASAASAPKVEPDWEREESRTFRREVGGVLLMALGVCMLLSYFDLDGVLLEFLAKSTKGLVGACYYLAAPALLMAGFFLFFHKKRDITGRVTSLLLLPVLLSAILDFNYTASLSQQNFSTRVSVLYEKGIALKSGGVLGGILGAFLEKYISTFGAMAVLIITCLFLSVIAFDIRFRNLNKYRGLFTESTESDCHPVAEPVPAAAKVPEPPAPAEPEPPAAAPPVRARRKEERRPSGMVDIPLGDEGDALPLQRFEEKKQPAPAPVKTSSVTRKVPVFREESIQEEVSIGRRAASPAAGSAAAKAVSPTAVEPVKPAETGIRPPAESEPEGYCFPPLSLLRSNDAKTVDARDEITANRTRLDGALKSFGINASVVGIIHGPTVTRYDIELEQGVKLARVTNLAGDIALALGVINVRIAPIPDKISTVGIEVPNKIVNTVYLSEILGSPQFESAKSKISFALGKDIGGDCIVSNIAKLPHLLIAGTTGSGKSVCMNSLILSILFKARPDEVKLIMIDPKMVELGIYNGIPHLYVPVVTDPKKASGALQWSVVEMLKRYRLFSEQGVRDLQSYNALAEERSYDPMPQIVIVIDELADLMMAASKEVEESICRVAQMGRAAGMHLVIATQRPSADVITGLMKANIPSRIAFAVSSAMESRIILDQAGAEKLVGMGDMLYSPVGCGKPKRIQGAFVSDDEREGVVDYIKEQAAAQETNNEIEDYMNKATESKKGESEKASEDSADGLGDYDKMLPEAVEAVLEFRDKGCSVSSLQRRLKLGYARAARIVDQLEELGVVGPYEGAKPRKVVMDRAGWAELQVSLGLVSTPSGQPGSYPGDGSEVD